MSGSRPPYTAKLLPLGVVVSLITLTPILWGTPAAWLEDEPFAPAGVIRPNFDSGDISLSPIQNGVHFQITAAAADMTGLAEWKKKFGYAVFKVDFDETTLSFKDGWPPTGPNAYYRPSHHFDRWDGASHAEAFEAGLTFLIVRRERYFAYLQKEQCDAAVMIIGQILHVRQDFVSHSNFIDLPDADQKTILLLLDGGQVTVPPSLKLTAYSKKATPPGRPPGDPYPHDLFSKDNATKNPHAQEKLSDGRTRFEAARDVAIANSADVLRELVLTERAAKCFPLAAKK